jgi:hypothetical protein
MVKVAWGADARWSMAMRVTGSAIRPAAAVVCLLFIASSARAESARRPEAGRKPPSDVSLVTSALSAAPAAVGRNAAVVAMSPGGGMRTIRQGSNGFSCMPDNPATPGPDPMCMDPGAMEWVMAWIERRTPPRKTGFMYMLAGGTDASNTDPYAEKPASGNHWVKTGPHVMIVGAPEMLAHYPDRPDPDTTQPYVMWAGTPYAHLMIPVR